MNIPQDKQSESQYVGGAWGMGTMSCGIDRRVIIDSRQR